MKRVGFLLKVKQDKIEEYRQHHEAVWPEMLDALRRTGWHNYSLYMRPDGLLFGYFETPESFQTALDGMAGEEINSPLAGVHGALLRRPRRRAGRREHVRAGRSLSSGLSRRSNVQTFERWRTPTSPWSPSP